MSATGLAVAASTVDVVDALAIGTAAFNMTRMKAVIEEVREACGIPVDDLEFRRQVARALLGHILLREKTAGEWEAMGGLLKAAFDALNPRLGNPVATVPSFPTTNAGGAATVTAQVQVLDPPSSPKEPPPGWRFAGATAMVDELLLECTRCSAGTTLISEKAPDLLVEHNRMHTTLLSPEELAKVVDPVPVP